MGFWADPKVKVGTNKQYDYVADSDSDIANLPTAEEDIDIGSSCLSIESGLVYILNSQRVWSPIGGE